MNTTSRIISILMSCGLLFFIFNLVRKNKLKEKYALLWLSVGIVMFILAIFQNLLYWITYILGIQMPINTVFFLGIFFMILINIHISLVISNLSEQNKILAQKIALLESALNNLLQQKQI
jgi:hypothetical protein